MKFTFRLTVMGIAALSLGITGCGLDQHPAYSPNIKYGQRTDPVIIGLVKDLGDERYDPDRPGMFPIMKLDEMFQDHHPYQAKSSELEEKVLRDPTKIPQQYRDELEKALEEIFGTPASPTVNAEKAKLDPAAIEELKLDAKTLAEGSKRYRIHCLHCHGVPGDGRGPTSRWINPHPRDFRLGTFKFQSIDRTLGSSDRPPSRSDLLRTLRQGIEGTAMPSFSLLKDDELEAIVSYVIHLSLRGRVEFEILKGAFSYDRNKKVYEFNKGENEDDTVQSNVLFFADKFFTKGWLSTSKPESAIKVAKYPYDESAPDYLTKVLPASVKRGQEIFQGAPSAEFIQEYGKKVYAKKFPALLLQANGDAAKAQLLLDEEVKNKLKGPKCISCHTDYGRQAKFKFDEWGTLVRPNNLPQGNIRGGKRPIDIYYRIHSGIPGSEMVASGTTFDEGQEHYLWDLVNFVTVLPYPTMRDSLKIKLD